jgi:D-arabinan exo alpha-(1,3)/(1,5)-arabinofuranosidase (non-reducing end)
LSIDTSGGLSSGRRVPRPRALTEGRSAIRIRVQFTPVKRLLFLGLPSPELAWSEISVSAYCFIILAPG